jgi:hypothetical protein
MICSRLKMATGAAVVRSLRRMREPVTTMSSRTAFFPVVTTPSLFGAPPVSSRAAGAPTTSSSSTMPLGWAFTDGGASGGVVESTPASASALALLIAPSIKQLVSKVTTTLLRRVVIELFLSSVGNVGLAPRG